MWHLLRNHTLQPYCPLYLLAAHPAEEASFEKLLKGKAKKVKQAEVWKTHSKKVRESLMLESTLAGAPGWVNKVAPSTALRGLNLSERLSDLVSVAVEASHGTSEPEEVEDIIIDLSQDVLRRPWTNGHCRSLTTSSDLFSVKRRRVVLPGEHFRLLGFPSLNLHMLSLAKQRDLSGEAMSPACMGVVCALGLSCLV